MKIRTFLKHLFIPHEGNKHRPYFFREHTMLTLGIGVLLLLTLSSFTYAIVRSTLYGKRITSEILTNLVNEARVEEGLPPLIYNSQLEQAATYKIDDMVAHNYFAHKSPEGILPWYWIRKAGYSFSYAGENLAINFTSSLKTQKAWMSSPLHKKNILNETYEDTGIAVARYVVAGTPTTFIVEMFAKPNKEKSSPSQGYLLPKPRIYETILFSFPRYVHVIYNILAIISSLAVVILITLEARKHHRHHIMYGLLMLALIFIASGINMIFMF